MDKIQILSKDRKYILNFFVLYGTSMKLATWVAETCCTVIELHQYTLVHLLVLIIYCVWYICHYKETCLSVLDSSLKIAVYWHLSRRYRSPATTVSQLKITDFSGKILKVLKCYNLLWVQRRHNCSPAASFANCVMTLYMLKMQLQTFLSISLTKKCQILSCDTLVANERCGSSFRTNIFAPKMTVACSSETLVCMTSHIWRL
jgi:hypothetical protein